MVNYVFQQKLSSEFVRAVTEFHLCPGVKKQPVSEIFAWCGDFRRSLLVVSLTLGA